MDKPFRLVAPPGRRRLLLIGTAVSLGAALTVAGGGLAAASGPASPAVAMLAAASGGSASGGHVIVVLKAQHSNLSLRTQGQQRTAAAHSSQAPIVASIKAHGGTGVTQLVSVDAVAADISAAEVSRLRRDPAVAQIMSDSTATVETGQPGQAGPALATSVARPRQQAACPHNPGQRSGPVTEPEALADIHASNGDPDAPDMANSIATGAGVIVAIAGMNELAGNPNFQRGDGSHVVIDAPDYTADQGNSESYGDASSVAAQGNVVYHYAQALPFSGLPASCTFVIKGDAPGASLVDSSQIDTPPSLSDTDSASERESQIVAGIDNAVITEHADVISESYGGADPRVPTIPHAANDAAVAAGVTVVVSAGDSGDSGTMNPIAADPAVIAAGAVDNFRLVAMAHGYSGYVSNNMAAISSGGTAPTNKLVDLVAPGYLGEAACADGSGGCPPNYPTESFRGTSEAAPLIAGAAADVIQAYRKSHGGASPTPAMIKEILTSTATDIDSPAYEQGAGLLDVYAAVKAAQQMPGATSSASTGSAASLIASPSQLDIAGNGGTINNQSVDLYNTGSSPVTVTGSYRAIGAERQIGRVVTENISAPNPALPVPAEGAKAATPITFNVPPGLDRLDADMIWPDPTNSNILCIALFDPQGRLEQLSYDDGSAGRNGAIGSVSDIQHVEVTNPEAGKWTAKILWSGKDVDLAAAPAVPGTYTGPMSFKVSGQNYVTSPATGPVTIRAHATASVPLRISMPVAPGDHPESVQFSAGHVAATSLPVARRTLIPANGGGFQTLITSTVGRSLGQVATFDISVPAGRSNLDFKFHTADASPDDSYTFYLINPSGTVASTASTPQTVNGQPVGDAEVSAAAPVTGTWQIDVELNLTVSGKEFTQTVYGNVTDPG